MMRSFKYRKNNKSQREEKGILTISNKTLEIFFNTIINLKLKIGKGYWSN